MNIAKNLSNAPKLTPDKDEIFEIFKRYNFQDEYGHPLLLCDEFIQLVNNYCDNSNKGKAE